MCSKKTEVCMLDRFEKEYMPLFAKIFDNLQTSLKDKFPNEAYKTKCMVLSTSLLEQPSAVATLDMNKKNVRLVCFDSMETVVALLALTEQLTIAKFHLERLFKSNTKMRYTVPIQHQGKPE